MPTGSTTSMIGIAPSPAIALTDRAKNPAYLKKPSNPRFAPRDAINQVRRFARLVALWISSPAMKSTTVDAIIRKTKRQSQ